MIADREFARILLIKPSSLGDVVHALPVLHGLRQRYPNARIDWLIGSASAPLLSAHPDVDDLIHFDRRHFGRVVRSVRATADFARFLRHLRHRRYDLTIDLQGLFRSGFLGWASGAPLRIGLAEAREAARVFYTHRVSTGDPETHAVDRYCRVGTLLGFGDVPVRFHLPLPAEDCIEAGKRLASHGLCGKHPWVAVAPGTRWETKRWAPERFAAAIDRLETDMLARCVLVGGAGERAVCDGIATACRTKPVNLAGKTSLTEWAALMQSASLVLCHDSAAAHLAAAFNRPLVCLVGPTNPARTGPYRRPHDVVRVELDCAPCYLRRLAQCPFDHRCMNDLAVSTVVQAVRRRLLASPAAWAPPVPGAPGPSVHPRTEEAPPRSVPLAAANDTAGPGRYTW